MEPIIYTASVMWSQLDVNRHLRHSAYADFATQARLELLNQNGLSIERMAELNLGPVLFREESNYHREISATDTIQVSCLLRRARKDGSRWAFEQKIYRGDGVLAATIYVEGAWLHLQHRKLTQLPQPLAEAFHRLDRTPDFEWQ